jgi:Transglutaminase-like superfamily
MSQYFLRNNVHACHLADGSVFLDLNIQKYLSIDSRQSLALSLLVEDWVPKKDWNPDSPMSDEESRAFAEALNRRGLLTRHLHDANHCRATYLASSDGIEFAGRYPDDPSIRLVHLTRFCHAYLSVRARLRLRSLQQIVSENRRRKIDVSRKPRAEDFDVRALVNIFRRIRPLFYTAHDNCLFDSLVLIQFIRNFSITTSWILGVSTRPFGAHSWVQYGGLVISDSLEHVREFSPILIV